MKAHGDAEGQMIEIYQKLDQGMKERLEEGKGEWVEARLGESRIGRVFGGTRCMYHLRCTRRGM
jgi:hypothetical protein